MASGPSNPPETTAGEHADAAESFLAHAERLLALHDDPALAPGWAIVAAFYAALHAITGYALARHNARAVAHEDRREWFRTYPEFAADQFPFKTLKDRSEGFRYYLKPYDHGTAEKTLAEARRIVAKWNSRTRKELAR